MYKKYMVRTYNAHHCKLQFIIMKKKWNDMKSIFKQTKFLTFMQLTDFLGKNTKMKTKHGYNFVANTKKFGYFLCSHRFS